MLWQQNRGAGEVAPPNRPRSRLRPQLGSDGGHCVHSLKSCQRGRGVPSYFFAVPADREPHRFPDTICR